MTTVVSPIEGYQSARRIELPEKCPMCKSSITPKIIRVIRCRSIFGDESEGVAAAFGCPACHGLFVAKYSAGTADDNFQCMETDPNYPAGKEFDPVLSEVSPTFVEIYNQALAAEVYGLSHIAGMGYRKSLEFLIKDYAKILDNSSSDDIEKMMLSPCIQKYIAHPKIKATAIASAWLGNDEAHYIRKFTEKDIGDLKRLINSCAYWILADRDAEEASEMISK